MNAHTPQSFAARNKLLTVRTDVQRIAQTIQAQLTAPNQPDLRATLDGQHPADLADAMLFLNEQEDIAVFKALDTDEAAEVLDEVDATTRAYLVRSVAPQQVAAMLERLPADEGADVLGALPQNEIEQVLTHTKLATAQSIRTLLAYDANTAGGIMSLGFVAVPNTATQAQAVRQYATQLDADVSPYVYVVDA